MILLVEDGCKWDGIKLTYRLQGHLHIGYLPRGGTVVAHTRRYLPGKNFWGAVTKRATEYLFPEPEGKDYGSIGEKIKKYFRFSYFYVTENGLIYPPLFTDEGLVYGSGSGSKMTEGQFEYRYIGNRVSTEIDSGTGTTMEGSLHEIEYIKKRYRNARGNIKNTEVSGCVWVKKGARLPDRENSSDVAIEISDEGIFIKAPYQSAKCNLLDEISIGGEQNYGFGRIEIVKVEKEKELTGRYSLSEEGVNVSLSSGEHILAHVPCNKNLSDVCFCGDIELLGGREYAAGKKRFGKPGARIVTPQYHFAPGSRLFRRNNDGAKMDFELQYDGTMNLVRREIEERPR